MNHVLTPGSSWTHVGVSLDETMKPMYCIRSVIVMSFIVISVNPKAYKQTSVRSNGETLSNISFLYCLLLHCLENCTLICAGNSNEATGEVTI